MGQGAVEDVEYWCILNQDFVAGFLFSAIQVRVQLVALGLEPSLGRKRC